MSETNFDLAIRMTTIAGGAAGDHVVTGITTKDVLKSVIHLVGDATQLTGAGNDLTDEFEISADDTINNAGGTATTNGRLIILYLAAGDGGDLNRS